MRNIIVGTAGHIDHGKTALVKALTGIDTDRLEEEKRRGISIDLGFAHLEMGPQLRLGFVDVPGHERFVKNMLAGVGGIDLVLLVIGADESIKPQTREHFDICRLLGIRRGIVVVTKTDLVDADILGLVRLEAEEFVRGSFLEAAPVVGVSSVTGQGLEELRRLLAAQATTIAVRDDSLPFRLPIDRSFSMRGFGTVVTGTLISGSIACEDEVEVQPKGRTLRVRGLHVHGAPVERAFAGQRTAVNLSGVEPGELGRGLALVRPGSFTATAEVDCVFDLLPAAAPLKHHAPVHFHAWTAETQAQARLLGQEAQLQPGGRGFVRFLLREPVLLLPGDRFIVRKFSPVFTIGGGRVLEIAPPRRLRRAETARRLDTLANGSPAQRLAVLVREAPHGVSVAAVAARSGVLPQAIESCAPETLVVMREPQPWLIDRDRLGALIERLSKALAEFHRQNPLLAGIPKGEFRSREMPDAPPFLFDALLKHTTAIVAEGELVRLRAHNVHLREEEESALSLIEAAFRQAGLAVPSTGEVLTRCGVDPERARSLLQILLRDKRLVRVSEDLVFHQEAIAQLRGLLASRRGERFTVSQFKDWTGVSRKYAIPLLEFLDRQRVTRREGDSRVVL